MEFVTQQDSHSPQVPSTIENSASIDNVTGLTTTFVNDNPADEIELVLFNGGVAKSFGFLDCTTLWNPLADPVGDLQYVHLGRGDQISLHLDPERDNQWCQDPRNNIPPVFSFQVHLRMKNHLFLQIVKGPFCPTQYQILYYTQEEQLFISPNHLA